MTYRATAPILALAALFVACAAEVEADIASGWTDYTLGPPLEITPQSVISKRSGQTTQNDYVLNNVIATPGGLWTFVSVSHGIAHWHDGAWRRVFAPGLPPDDFTVQYSDRGAGRVRLFRLEIGGG